MLNKTPYLLALAALTPAALAHPAISHDEPVTTVRNVIDWSPMAHCTNWNPFQCRVTATHTETVVQEITSTMYVLVESTTTETIMMPVKTGMGCPGSHHMPHTMTGGPEMTMAGRYIMPPHPPMSTGDGVERTVTAVPIPVPMDPLCPSAQKGPHHQSSKPMASIWMIDQKTMHMPTGTSMAMPIMPTMPTPPMHTPPMATPSMPSTPGMPDDEMHIEDMMPGHENNMVPSKDMGKGMDYNKPNCVKKALHTYTLTFDDLHVPHIPKPYYGLEFSSHFSVFEPALIYTTYTAPSPPYAAISYPSSNSTIMSGSPFNLVSMYIGCEFAQTCLIRIRGWAPNQIMPTAEIQVKVNQEHENWTLVEFGNYGFNGLTMLEFDVLDLVTGMRGTLGLTMDEMMITREVFELRDCFE